MAKSRPPPPPDAIIRPARRADLESAGRCGAALARAHHAWDPGRFFVVEDMEAGYSWWLGKELANRRAVILVAERAGRVVGYAYGRLEPRDWNALREACGYLIDLWVDEDERGEGLGKRLCSALAAALGGLGAPFATLMVAAKNRRARRLFQALGYRPTMIEMTLDLDGRTSDGPRRAKRRAR
jgi:ribosomal protein S18 acetylase RimI-like enzyme